MGKDSGQKELTVGLNHPTRLQLQLSNKSLINKYLLSTYWGSGAQRIKETYKRKKEEIKNMGCYHYCTCISTLYFRGANSVLKATQKESTDPGARQTEPHRVSSGASLRDSGPQFSHPYSGVVGREGFMGAKRSEPCLVHRE